MKKLVLLLIAGLSASSLLAQNLTAIEKDLVNAYQKVEAAKDESNYELLSKVNGAFMAKLKAFAIKYPATLTHPFNKLKAVHVNVVTAPDGLFRIYSWDSLTGGTMHFFYNLFQYRSGGKVSILPVIPEEGDAGLEYNKAYQLNTGDKTVYLFTTKSIGSSRDISEGINLFAVENGKVTDAKIFKTSSGLKSRITYSYNFFSIVDWKERPEPRYDEKLQIIYLPLVNADDKMTHQFIRYKFDGTYFTRLK